MNTFKRHIPLVALMMLFTVGAWIQGRVLPVLEGGDEWLQLSYVEHLRTTWTLPDRTLNETGPVRQQSGQPPLTYFISALATLNLPTFDTWAMMDHLQRDSNNWFAPPDPFNRRDNNNVFYLSNEPANTPEIVTVVRAVRWIAPLYGVIAIVAMYAAAWEVFRQRGWVLTATALFAFTPTFVHSSSFLTTDGGAAAVGTVLLWLSLVMVRRGATWQQSLWIGLALGVAGLTKLNALLMAPMVGVALVIAISRQSTKRIQNLISHSVLMAIPFVLTFGVWVLWGWLAYGDPLGTQTHRFPGQYFDPPLPIAEVLRRMPEVYLSYWGKFASAVYLHPVTYGVLTGVLVVAGLGYVLPPIPDPSPAYRGREHNSSMPRRKSPHRLRRGDLGVRSRTLWVLLTAALTLFAGVWYWVATINFITGRLMFPAHGAIAIFVTGGFYALAQRFPRLDVWLRGVLVVPVAITGLVIAPLAIHAAYTPPRAAVIENLTPSTYTYEDTIQVIGWHSDTTTITSGELYTVTLCWQVLEPATRPAAYSLKIVKDGVPVGERTTVHGLGRYDWRQWEAGHTFCDALDVPIGAVEAGTSYDMILVMLDAQTGAVDWQAAAPDGKPVPFPWLGRVAGK